MNQIGQKIVAIIALGTFALVIGLGELRKAQAQGAKEPYPSMATLDQYLMERNAEIAIARSAAPEAISRDADVLVLGRHGYETGVKGKNGFVCLVERGWMGPFDGEFAVNFWNPKVRFPRADGRMVRRTQSAKLAMRTNLSRSRNRGPSWIQSCVSSRRRMAGEILPGQRRDSTHYATAEHSIYSIQLDVGAPG